MRVLYYRPDEENYSAAAVAANDKSTPPSLSKTLDKLQIMLADASFEFQPGEMIQIKLDNISGLYMYVHNKNLVERLPVPQGESLFDLLAHCDTTYCVSPVNVPKKLCPKHRHEPMSGMLDFSHYPPILCVPKESSLASCCGGRFNQERRRRKKKKTNHQEEKTKTPVLLALLKAPPLVPPPPCCQVA